ncbi:YbaB/EbfC family nucleoid-associated protein [Microtetraspora sp. AC03309]|uniref:YbaB/EbfC family nucleoid-associated protein n=1 Tax=Microtetraspora sp. AC03309 TaxID=2779376 RepID=UPI001E304E51|nr:YbaB/EbfC family nucleoid-associated protein [Microtetraspora sp. AC03309]MCC5575707.1 YbaB/EbfC family nucleoid-associated protein [Microtetraspora sp. AC03309]
MDEFTRTLGVDPERMARDADRFFDQMPAIHRDVDGIAVRAESDDGRIAVDYSNSSGVQGIDIDPRAMRMGSDELAETILGLIHQARHDAETRARERATEHLDPANSLIADRRLLGDLTRDATRTLEENLRDATEMIERLRALIRP